MFFTLLENWYIFNWHWRIDMVNTLKDVGIKLKTMREQNDLTQEIISAFLNIDQNLLSNIENGEKSIPVEVLEELATLYGVNLSYFEESDNSVQPLTITLRPDEIDEKDLETISIANRVALNCSFITKLLRYTKCYER
jgi:transcriptional regulator with XRE-family HTH domain